MQTAWKSRCTPGSAKTSKSMADGRDVRCQTAALPINDMTLQLSQHRQAFQELIHTHSHELRLRQVNSSSSIVKIPMSLPDAELRTRLVLLPQHVFDSAHHTYAPIHKVSQQLRSQSHISAAVFVFIVRLCRPSSNSWAQSANTFC